MALSPSLQAAIAAHRFGLGEADLGRRRRRCRRLAAGADRPGRRAARQRACSTRRQALALVAAEREARRQATNPPPGMTAEQAVAGHYRETIRRRRALAPRDRGGDASGRSPNGCNGSGPTTSPSRCSRAATRGLVGAFERDAIRPNIAGRFETLLVAATTHPAMLRYLDNYAVGRAALARRRAARRGARRARDEGRARHRHQREPGARGAGAAHARRRERARRPSTPRPTSTAFAAVLTGWRIGQRRAPDRRRCRSTPTGTSPAPRRVLGQSYGEGPDALTQVLHDLARIRATARFVATKLARHFVADEPPPALVDRLAAAYLDERRPARARSIAS